ncbi:MAG TPA: thiamine phosphate synthase [Paracoccaceae bacterium]|nr:thiamine phosphate synthase [Paracoccaceae bacterium]HMO72429.1 thiamine phosphate synthase [Paracoccaceae bacterium]
MPQAPERPQIVLVTPPAFDPAPFAETLARVLDAVPVACLRLAPAGRDLDAIARAADALRPVAHDRDVAVVIETHVLLAQRLGLDGVHLTDGARSLRKVRKDLGADAIVGAFCGTTRHEGINAAEAGADYVSFGPAAATGLGDGAVADPDLFDWWSQMIEVPVVAEGGLTPEIVARLAPAADFFALGEEVWRAADPVAALRALDAAIG